MAYYFFIIIFLIFGTRYQLTRKIYLFDKEMFKIPKIINIIVTVALILYIASNVNSTFLIISDFKEFLKLYHTKSGIISANINLVSKIINICLNFYMLFVIYNLVHRNGNYRKIFVRLMPFLLISMTIEYNQVMYEIGDVDSMDPTFRLVFAFFYNSVKFIILFFIYNSKAFKRFMCLDSEKIKELAFNENQY